MKDEQNPGGADDSGGDDRVDQDGGDRTPTRGIKLVSRSAAGVANVALQIRETARRLSSVAEVLGDSALEFEALPEHEQEFLLIAKERILGQVGDICHEYRHALEAIRHRHKER